MQYIDYINSFWDFASLNPLSTGQVSLYFALLHVSNRSYWTEWFTAPNQVLSVLTGLSRSGILKARNELKQKGLIDFKERGTKATSYKLLLVNNKQESNQTNILIANSTQESKQESNRMNVLMANSKQVSKQDSVQDGKQVGVQDSSTLYKTKDIRHKTKDRPPISPCERFGEFWQAYPKKMNLLKAQGEYAYLLQTTPELTEELLITAASNYAESCEILHTKEQYIKYPENWLKDSSWVSYLPENYKKPKPEVEDRRGRERQQSNKFNHFQQNAYDFEQLEKELLSN